MTGTVNRRHLLYGGAAAALSGTAAVAFSAADSPAAPAVKEPATSGHPRVVRYDMCLLASHGPDNGFLAVNSGQDTGFTRFVDCVTPS
ncbi:hypothetical protein [Actinacidiphila soli]|jgi:hypothetical protein|uniref:hypothetical protein n=1 Tax=Actinacidiphila soli TaxID=2487275 RepID=UPI000FC9CBD3|nr:hypothetical protein [Actinacidiphila soli]